MININQTNNKELKKKKLIPKDIPIFFITD